jgi:hypothetical protein
MTTSPFFGWHRSTGRGPVFGQPTALCLAEILVVRVGIPLGAFFRLEEHTFGCGLVIYWHVADLCA